MNWGRKAQAERLYFWLALRAFLGFERLLLQERLQLGRHPSEELSGSSLGV